MHEESSATFQRDALKCAQHSNFYCWLACAMLSGIIACKSCAAPNIQSPGEETAHNKRRQRSVLHCFGGCTHCDSSCNFFTLFFADVNSFFLPLP